MFGFRVGKFLALGIVPDGQSPSLYKQFLLLLLFVFPLAQTQLALLQKNVLFCLTMSSVPRPGSTIFHPQPQIFANSKINTAPNTRLTHFHCGWFCFQFSHHLSHSTFSEVKEKSFRENKKQQTNNPKNANQIRKAHVFFIPMCVLDQKCATRCYEDKMTNSSVVLKWLSMFSFPFFFS